MIVECAAIFFVYVTLVGLLWDETKRRVRETEDAQ